METIILALKSLTTNKLRSSLTILGIIVGIFSIIAISTVIAMLQSSIEDGLSGLGQNTFQIQKWPRIRTSGDRSEWAKIRNRKAFIPVNKCSLRQRHSCLSTDPVLKRPSHNRLVRGIVTLNINRRYKKWHRI